MAVASANIQRHIVCNSKLAEVWIFVLGDILTMTYQTVMNINKVLQTT